MMRVLVTGGTGFIGSHLVRRLVSEGAEVHVLARPSSSLWRIEDVVSKVTVWRAELADEPALTACVTGCAPEVVYHLAGDTSGRRWTEDLAELERCIGANLLGTLHLLRALRQRPPVCVVRAGGLSEYGDAPVPFEEEQRERPVSAYGASQAATSMFVSALSTQLCFPVITLRFAAVYGPRRDESFFLPSVVVRCLEGKDFEMTSGDQMWDMVYIDDAVDALLKAAGAGLRESQTINIGGGAWCTLREIAERVAEKTGGRSRILAGALAVQGGDIRQLYCRIDRAKDLLGWQPVTDLDTGLDRTIAWYRMAHTGK